jgi:hypothetical protein
MTRTTIEDLAPTGSELSSEGLEGPQGHDYGREPAAILSSIRFMGTSGTTTATGQSDEDN